MTPGTRLANRYEIVRPLGAGGMGQVFLARDTQLERDVAVKLLPPNLLADAVSRERLRREARSAAPASRGTGPLWVSTTSLT